MKVKITYTIKTEKIVDMTPEDFCYLRASMSDPKYFPSEARDKDMDPADANSRNELWDYLAWRQIQIHGEK